MILAIDVGNTNTVIGCIEEGQILNILRIQTKVGETETEYAIRLKQLLEFTGVDPAALEGAILSSVVPPVTGALYGAVERLTGCRCLVVRPGMKTGMNVRIDDPSSLAADLAVGSVAAMSCYGTPVLIMDLGTATTVVAVDANGCYRGGTILPGIRTSYAALSADTSLLPDISIRAPKKCIGTNTVDAMRAGAVFGTAAAIDGMIDRMEEELGCACKLVATGGLASTVIPHCRHRITVDDDLLLKGLWVLYQKNKK